MSIHNSNAEADKGKHEMTKYRLPPEPDLEEKDTYKSRTKQKTAGKAEPLAQGVTAQGCGGCRGGGRTDQGTRGCHQLAPALPPRPHHTHQTRTAALPLITRSYRESLPDPRALRFKTLLLTIRQEVKCFMSCSVSVLSTPAKPGTQSCRKHDQDTDFFGSHKMLFISHVTDPTSNFFQRFLLQNSNSSLIWTPIAALKVV